MKFSTLLALVLITVPIMAAGQQSSRTTQEVYRHHEQAFLNQNIDELLQDYTDSSILITPDGQVHKGKEAIRQTFQEAFPAIFPTTTKLNIIHEVIEEDMVYTVYTAIDTASGEAYMPFATDTFIIKDGKIRYQTVAAQMSGSTPKE